jgi:hypothetical protein
LVFETVDGHTACVPLEDMVDGLLALQRLDGASPPTQTDMPRVVAPGLDGPHAVKHVQNIEPVSIEPAEDPHDWEAFNLEPKSSDG